MPPRYDAAAVPGLPELPRKFRFHIWATDSAVWINVLHKSGLRYSPYAKSVCVGGLDSPIEALRARLASAAQALADHCWSDEVRVWDQIRFLVRRHRSLSDWLHRREPAPTPPPGYWVALSVHYAKTSRDWRLEPWWTADGELRPEALPQPRQVDIMIVCGDASRTVRLAGSDPALVARVRAEMIETINEVKDRIQARQSTISELANPTGILDRQPAEDYRICDLNADADEEDTDL